MKRADVDWRVLRGAVALVIVSVVVGGGFLASSYYFWSKMNTVYQRQHRSLLGVRARYQTLDQEAKIIHVYLPRYERLEGQGIIGPEHRLNWIEALRTVSRRVRLPSLRYTIDAQVPSRLAYLPDPGVFRVYDSKMEVKLGLLHEGDLLDLLRDLARASTGLYSVTSCDIRRAHPKISMDPKHANLLANCDLRWYTLRKAQAGKPAT